MPKPKTKIENPTLGCRVSKSELDQIDAIAAEVGQSRAQWLHGLVMEALGKESPDTVRSMSARIAVLERKLQLLAR